MFSMFTNWLCFGYRWFHELENFLYDEICYNDNYKGSEYHKSGWFGNRGYDKYDRYDKSDKHSLKSLGWYFLLPSFGAFLITTIAIIYGLLRLSRYTSKSIWGSMQTAECVAKDVNLTGKVAIVTGASDGLGKETCKVLLKQGACVIMGVHDRQRGEEARKDIVEYLTSKNYQSQHTLEKRIIMLSLDLSSLQSVRDFVINFNKLGLPLHYLINNGGIMATPFYELSKDGIENQFQVNYLSHYYLTRLLASNLSQTPNSRIINVSSLAHNYSPKPFSNWLNKHLAIPQGPLKEEYSQQGFTEYGISKACLILFTREFQKRYHDILSLSLHPGDVDTKLWDRNHWFSRFRHSFMKLFKLFPGEFKSVEQGAGTIMYCVVKPSDELKAGHYYRDCTDANDHLRKDILIDNDNEEEKLWELSEKLIQKAGFDFKF